MNNTIQNLAGRGGFIAEIRFILIFELIQNAEV